MHLSKNLIARAALLLVFVVLLAPARDAAESKNGLKGVGKDLRKLGREVGEAGKEAGREIAGAAKDVFYKGKKVSRPILRDVQQSTREFWAEVVAGKDRTIAALRRENAELKRQLGDDD